MIRTYNYIQVISPCKGYEVESISNFFNRKSFSRNPNHPQARNLQAMLTGEMLKILSM